MALALDTSIPEWAWYSLLEQRISNPIKRRHKASDSATVPCHITRFLTADPCTYLDVKGEKVITKLLALKLAEVMLPDLSDDGEHKLPVALWNREEMLKKRNIAEKRLRQNDKEKLADGILEGERWIQKICGEKNGTFTSVDLLPVGKLNDPFEETMAGLASKVDTLSQKAEFRLRQCEDPTAYVALILDLGKAAIKCSDMETYIRISLFLFLAVNRLWICMSESKSNDEWKEMRVIGRKYLRNYVTLVLLGESLSMFGDVQKKKEPPI